MSTILIILVSLLLFGTVVESSNCKSINAEDLSDEQIHICWEMFCKCHQYDNCSRLGQPLEDVMVMLYIRMGVVLCGRPFAKIYEPNGWPFDFRIDGQQYSEELMRFTVEYEDFTKMDHFLREDPRLIYPPSLMNPYWGYHFNTSALLSGYFSFKNSNKKLSRFDDRNTLMDPVYYRISYTTVTKDKFDGEERSGSLESQMLGPFGKKAMMGKSNSFAFMAFPYFNIYENFAFKLSIDDMVIDSNYEWKGAYVKHIVGHLRLDICVGKTVDKRTGQTFWTSEGCRPILYYSAVVSPNNLNAQWFYVEFSGKCLCDWVRSPPSMPTNQSSDDSNGVTTDRNHNEEKSLKVKSNTIVLVLLWILLFLSIVSAVVLTVFLVLSLID